MKALADYLRISLVVLLGYAFLWPAVATAQNAYPNKPIRLVIAYPPGGSTDIVARAFAQRMSDQLGQPIVVENKPGASGIVATEEVAAAAPDGYTMLQLTAEYTLNLALRKKLTYSFANFVPISVMSSQPMFLAARSGLGIQTLPELIKAAKARPGEITYASWGAGSSAHLAIQMLANAAGIEMLHVPYKGGVPAITDLLGNRVDLSLASIPIGAMHFDAGRLVPLAISSAQRLPLFPNVPSVAETLPGYDVSMNFGLAVPAGTPTPIVERLHKAVSTAATDDGLVRLLAKQGILATSSKSPAEYSDGLRAEIERWRSVSNAVALDD